MFIGGLMTHNFPQVLNLTCAMVGGDTAICDSDEYLYESPLSPNLLKFMSNLEVVFYLNNVIYIYVISNSFSHIVCIQAILTFLNLVQTTEH